MENFKPIIGKGDSGYTDIFLKRVPKTDLRIKLNAALDEINAYIALVRNKTKRKDLLKIQKDLIFISSIVAGYIEEEKASEKIEDLEKLLKRKSRGLNINKFVIFGEKEESAILNLIRTKIRICEIISWQIKLKNVAKYLNRLSDYFFVISMKR